MTNAQGSTHKIQVVETPRWFLDRVEQHFGRIYHDAAATAKNAVVPSFFSEENSALTQDWPLDPHGVVWCNPPFRLFGKFTAKAAEQQVHGVDTVMLVTASISCNWWQWHVHRRAHVFPIKRIKFVGHDTPFPKDLALLYYNPLERYVENGYHRRLDWSEPKE